MSVNEPFRELKLPTAVQLAEVGHETLVSAVSDPLLGLGLGTTVKAVPFQCSTRVLPREAVNDPPTT